MKSFFGKKLIKKVFILFLLIYVSVIFVNQQKTLISYNSQKKLYSSKIENAENQNQTLLATKDNLDSKEYIEAISREKLDMYSQNERVYININK